MVLVVSTKEDTQAHGLCLYVEESKEQISFRASSFNLAKPTFFLKKKNLPNPQLLYAVIR